MGLMGNGRAKYDATPVPRLREIGLQRELDERSSPKNLLDGGGSQVPDETKRLKEILAGTTREPRAAIDEIEREISSLRDLINSREQMLVDAIDQHAHLSREAVHGMTLLRQALGQIRDAFNAAMHFPPMPNQRSERARSNNQPAPE